MNRFVELCVVQYYAETEKQALFGEISASAISFATVEIYQRQINDISNYSKTGEQFISLKNAFDEQIKKLQMPELPHGFWQSNTAMLLQYRLNQLTGTGSHAERGAERSGLFDDDDN